MILIDSSAWVEYLRATGSATDGRVTDLLTLRAAVATTEVVVMEVLAGARNDRDRDDLRRLLLGCTLASVRGPTDYEDAAELYRRCRHGGETIRKLTDCLIAVVALRTGAKLLHRDVDFEAIARHAPLLIA